MRWIAPETDSVFSDSPVGYRLQRSSWGQGLATEGARTLLAHAFTTLDQPAVDACAVPDNLGSIAVLKKCGMHHVGAFMHPLGNMMCERYLVEAQGFEQNSDD